MIQLRHTYLPEGYENGPPPRPRDLIASALWQIARAFVVVVGLMAFGFAVGAVIGSALCTTM